MLAILVRNNKIIQGTGMSFAILGTSMHMLNIANLVTPTLSHAWSAIAIAGFFMTASSQIGKGLITKAQCIGLPAKSSVLSSSARNDDVALP